MGALGRGSWERESGSSASSGSPRPKAPKLLDPNMKISFPSIPGNKGVGFFFAAAVASDLSPDDPPKLKTADLTRGPVGRVSFLFEGVLVSISDSDPDSDPDSDSDSETVSGCLRATVVLGLAGVLAAALDGVLEDALGALLAGVFFAEAWLEVLAAGVLAATVLAAGVLGSAAAAAADLVGVLARVLDSEAFFEGVLEGVLDGDLGSTVAALLAGVLAGVFGSGAFLDGFF
mmetsp:Transcript_31731/g.57657  ORF Transcript_31731/g.57657 Transcript_31731/m.57657 type:complete len:232 (+) Transcript_31731:874-1569(+)